MALVSETERLVQYDLPATELSYLRKSSLGATDPGGHADDCTENLVTCSKRWPSE
jgi:hypothetical protein